MSDKINRLIQQANIDKERAERLLEEIKVMDEQIAALTRELAEARDKALEEAAKALEEYEEKIHYGRYANLQAAQDTALEIISLVRALKEKP